MPGETLDLERVSCRFGTDQFFRRWGASWLTALHTGIYHSFKQLQRATRWR